MRARHACVRLLYRTALRYIPRAIYLWCSAATWASFLVACPEWRWGSPHRAPLFLPTARQYRLNGAVPCIARPGSLGRPCVSATVSIASTFVRMCIHRAGVAPTVRRRKEHEEDTQTEMDRCRCPTTGSSQTGSSLAPGARLSCDRRR